MPDRQVDILVVDDNPSDVQLMLYVLKNHGLGDRVQVAMDGAEALEFLFCTGRYSERNIQNQPKVILLDLKLPLVDGLEMLRRIKSDARTRAVPVVVVTSSRAERDICESYELGVNSYIVKPIDFQEFSESVKSLSTYWLRLNQPPLLPDSFLQERRRNGGSGNEVHASQSVEDEEALT